MVPSPKKATRSSPRKKAWASPPKASIFDEDFSLMNKSWAEITAEDEDLNASMRERLTKSDSRRKASAPKKAITKPKFVRSLELTEVVYQSTGRRSDRIRTRGQQQQTSSPSTNVSNKHKKAIQRDLPIKLELEEPTTFASTAAAAAVKLENLDAAIVVKHETTIISSNVSVNLSSMSTRITRAQNNTTPTKNPRKRHLSSASTIPEEGISPTKTARKTMRPDGSQSPNINRMPRPVATSSPRLNVKEGWVEPKLGWCEDPKTIDRRTKELERAKAKDVYKKYTDEVPRANRVRGEHPKTPNKMLNYSRRAWDGLVRQWKRSLYAWAGWEPSESVNTSFMTNTTEDENERISPDNKSILGEIRDLEDIIVRPETDAMASLLGHFDIDSKRGDESTLKAPTGRGVVGGGPTDFSNLQK